ncbi:hypothetical protein Btru_064670 [Bulinus truncatus]|nr:hypothetical protein Btru_064670 [Bulinus truncatus]
MDDMSHQVNRRHIFLTPSTSAHNIANHILVGKNRNTVHDYTMKMLITRVVLCLTVVLSLGVCDWTLTINTYSSACQETIAYNASKLITADCNVFNSTNDTYLTLVRFGFCTEKEFNNLTATVCGSSSGAQSDSEAKLNFYKALSKTTIGCPSDILVCLDRSVNALVLKQQEQYCLLMNLGIHDPNSQWCSPCTPQELNELETAACQVNKTETDQKFSTAILSVSSTCRSKLSICGYFSSQAKQLVFEMRYCESFNITQDGFTTEMCFKENTACSSEEFDRLKDAACDATCVDLRVTTLALCWFIALIGRALQHVTC